MNYINNFIRGGQVWFHKSRMIIQNIYKTIKWSFIISSIIISIYTYNKKSKEISAIYLSEFISLCKIQISLLCQSQQFFSFAKKSGIMLQITYITRYGKQTQTLRYALNDYYLKTNMERICILMKSTFTIFIICFFIIALLLSLIWIRFGFIQNLEKKQISFFTSKEVLTYLKSINAVSWLKIGDFPLIKNSETAHILISGSTGTGKTNLFHILLAQITQQNHQAIVIDQTGEITERYYDESRGDIIFNPYDLTASWDFFSELNNQLSLESFAATIFVHSQNSDPMWSNAARQIFCDTVNYISNLPDTNPSSVYSFFLSNDLSKIRKCLKNTLSEKYLDPSNDKTCMSILSTVITFIRWIKILPNNSNKFTIQNFIQSGKGWLFINSTPMSRSIVQPLQSALLDLTVTCLMDLKPDLNRRVWFVLDEVASLNKLITLPKALAEIRKYGGCVLAGLQSLNQLISIYSYSEAKTMRGQFNTQVYFRINEPELAKEISSSFGENIHEKQQETISYGSHEMRDGVNINKIEKTKQLLEVKELMSLENLECLIALPDKNIRLSKIKTQIAKRQNIFNS